MVKVTRLNGQEVYLNYLQIELMESIPETKIKMMNGNYYLVKDSVESVYQQVRELLRNQVEFRMKQREDA